MAKGYWVGLVDVDDPEAYKAYVRENALAFNKYGARFLIRGGQANKVEGKPRARTVVIEFSNYQTALDCWNSPEYIAAIALRENVSTADIVVVEGYDGPQPTDM
ncbi:DUF1330 domain-containing protein [Mesorhizobium waimense]|uniref:DUF1330 domain-containing protein n=1 Tax=Mesorhizobium waimense TaxID=1300307 RepID=A0A3A5L1Q9_9HYPH|nr:DUF1330 domain-containing protein [Mesorhizobium waimense]RJT41444.1 DUF1330 domain-containing protein [Mesorhizobium waimense]